MQRRSAAAAAGRPSGTDGSDFSYRMVVDSRYTRVAKGKSRLGVLLATQAINLLIGSLVILLSASEVKNIDTFTIASFAFRLVSVMSGEIGRRRSLVMLLRLYTIFSSLATALQVVSMIRSGLFFKVINYQRALGLTTYELLETSCALVGLILLIFILITTMTLLHNMSPPKRAS